MNESPEAIILEHHFETYRTIARACGGTHGSGPAYEWALAPSGNTYPNFIFNEKAEAVDIGVLKKQIAAKELPPFWISPDPNLEAVIGPAGFRLIRVWQGLAMRPEELVRPASVPGLEYLKVQSEEQLDAWTEIAGRVFNTPIEKGYFYPLLRLPEVELFLGRKEGEFVGTAMNFYRGDTVSQHMSATLPACRRQGIGQWMLALAVGAAFEAGARLAVCSATPEGISPWQKIGYKVYSKLYIYWLVGKENI
ncbi:MAG: GNAT family N-acetyltransferase [Phaeodactylibacter sp.]|nr:GNAT family N-acetyltransferase [Phaeodactylibacter sp.]